jgi:hypothetical protein
MGDKSIILGGCGTQVLFLAPTALFQMSLGQRPRLMESPIASAEGAIQQGPKAAQCG